MYVNNVYLARLYNIDIIEFFEFFYGMLYGMREEILDNPKYRNLISILADRPIVNDLKKISNKLLNTLELSAYRINRLLREIDKEMVRDKLWSYVGNFNYKKSMKGFALFILALYSNLDMTNFSIILYDGELSNYLKDNIKPPHTLNHVLASSFHIFLISLDTFIDTVYLYNTKISNL